MITPNNYFKFKYKLLDFERIPAVKEILSELYKIENDELQDYVDKNNIYRRLVDAYWLSIYGDKETIKLVEEILYSKFFGSFGVVPTSEKVEEIKNMCIERNREDLKDKILNVCPNGDQVVKVLLNSFFSSRGLKWKQI